MKKLLSIIAIVFVVVSCSKSTEKEHPIVGTWIMTAYFLEEPTDNNGDGIISDDFLDELPCLEREYIFMDDGTFELTTMLVTVNQTTGIWSCAQIRTLSGTWTINDDQFTTMYDSGNMIINTWYFELTDDTLVLNNDYAEIVLEGQ